ncbi:hypothetical protein [Spirosoma pollinicola]|uniref:Outer membrane protein beta-barrel domain-containing protein n=1 Tax=Spirosoma pollinicola TaxID=2057025 RepID=A0A2K8YTW0_9BACT|nr:hypothetical protein [Spirosoma pollinicola]AUD01086.1 hypothetical protein CWM47_04145 [Spirosoma pollinicola]
MDRSLILLSSLLIRVVALAQPATPINPVSRSNNGPVTPETAPRKIKATESPVCLKVYGLYGLLTPGVQIANSDFFNLSNAAHTFQTANKGLGAGPRAGAGLGFIVSDFINLGIDADILLGTDLKIINNQSDGRATYNSSTTSTLKVLSVIPNITFKALSRPTYYIYNRLGLVGGVVQYKVVLDYIETVKGGGYVHETRTENEYTKNSLAIGYQAALGIQFRFSRSLRGFAEIIAYNQSFRPKELTTITSRYSDGILSKVTQSVTEFSTQSTASAVSGLSVQQPTYNVPLNSVGVGAGLVFRF